MRKYWAAKDKRSSLFYRKTNDEEKSFINTGTG